MISKTIDQITVFCVMLMKNANDGDRPFLGFLPSLNLLHFPQVVVSERKKLIIKIKNLV